MSSALPWLRHALPVTVLLVVPMAFVGLQAPAAHAIGVPTTVSPASNTSSAGNTPTFAWTRVSGATTYEVQVDDDPSFLSPHRATTVNNRWVSAKPLPAGDNYWRVRGLATGVQGPWSNETQFSVNPLAGPTITPVSASPLPQPSEPPLLTWQAIPRATGYEVEVATEPEFLVPAKYSTSTTSYVVPSPGASEQYFWRVRAVLGTGITTQWSSTGDYEIADLATVTGHTPPDHELVEDVVLTWDPVPGAVTYDLRVGLDPDLNTWEEEVLGIRGTQYSPANTYNNNDGWYWKVRAVNAKGEKIPWADVELREFQRQWLDAPDLVHPADGINPAHGDDFYFEWSPVQHATHYELWVGSDPNFSPTTYKICRTAGTTYTAGYLIPDDCMPRSQGQVYYWKVRGIDTPASPNVQGIFSPTWSFIYDSGRVELSSPANGATVAVPTLRWKAQREAATYHVRIEGTGGYSVSRKTYALSWTPPSLDATKGPFTWRVQAEDENGSLSPAYPGRTFTLGGSVVTAAAPLTPMTGTNEPANARVPSLSWAPMPDAAYYRIRVGVHGSGFWQETGYTPFLNTQFKFPAATDWDPKLALDGTSYDWQVRAFTAANTPIVTASTDDQGWGPTGTYAISPLPAVTGQRIALTGSALDSGTACGRKLDDPNTDPDICTNVPSTPVLDWDPVVGASAYLVYLAEDREMTNLVYPPMRTGNTRWTPHLGHTPKALPDNDANKAYYWFIRPCKWASACGPDPISNHNSATHAFSKTSPAVLLEAPVTETEITDGRIAFRWKDYLETNLESKYQAPGVLETDAESSNQAAQKYRIEVSTTNTFNSLVDFAEVDQTSYSPWKKTYPEGRLYWRVQAIDAAGNRLTRSMVRTFVKNTPAPQLEAPLGDVLTNGLEAFRWEPSNHAKSYTLEVYKNADVTFSSTNRVFTCTTPQTACTNSKPFAASATSYLWRVRWTDADSRPGPWSATGRFRSSGQPPGLLAPASGAYVASNGSYFTWTAPPTSGGATYFRFERRPYGSSSLSETVITQATAYAPTALIADGTWQWRVTALDALKQVIASSSWRTFSVDGTRPTVKTWTPSAWARPGSNFVVTFSEPVGNVTRSTFRVRRKGTTTWLRATVSLSADRKRAVLNPSTNLRLRSKYVVQVTTSVKDPRGNKLVAKTWTVTVR